MSRSIEKIEELIRIKEYELEELREELEFQKTDFIEEWLRTGEGIDFRPKKASQLYEQFIDWYPLGDDITLNGFARMISKSDRFKRIRASGGVYYKRVL